MLPGFCYKVLDNEASWSVSKSNCESFGGELASIRTSSEQNFVYSK